MYRVLLDPFSVTEGLKVTQGTHWKPFPVKYATPPLHFATALLCWHMAFCAMAHWQSPKQEVGTGSLCSQLSP